MEGPTPVDMLLVEDNPADVYLVQRAVAGCSPAIRLTAMFGGREALEFLRKEPPFVNKPSPILIILDLSLPRGDGHDLIREIRGMPEYRRTPVVVLSAHERAVEEARCLALGANAYVQKSSNFTDYFGSIKALVRHWLGTVGAPSRGRRAREYPAVPHWREFLGWPSGGLLLPGVPLFSEGAGRL
jgi:CheY-like chemotaxis protein